ETFDAAIILVAVRLVDLPLAPKLGFLGPDADTVRLHRTIAATFAHRAVDKHALRRIGEFAALAAAALFGGAGLFIDDDGDALDLAQFTLERVELVAVMHRHAAAQATVRVIKIGAVGDDDTALDTLCQHLPRDVAGRQRPVERLTA